MNFHKPTPESFELIISGSFDELKFLVEEPDFDINEGDEDDLSALHLAVELNKEDIIRLLLENGAKINAYTFELKLTPLHIAVRNNLIQVVDLLLANEADINFRNKLEHTPLHVAVSTNNIEMARLLLFWGADPNIRTSDPRKETPLTKAATISWQLTSLLLDSGAVLSNESKELHVAILANKPDIANKILIHMKPPYNLLPNRIGKTPLQSVASHITNCDPSVAVNLMTRLIAMGDNVNYVNHFGSVLHILISRGSQDLISSACFDYILSVPDRDCDLIAPSLGSPLEVAFRSNQFNFAVKLIRHGFANVSNCTLEHFKFSPESSQALRLMHYSGYEFRPMFRETSKPQNLELHGKEFDELCNWIKDENNLMSLKSSVRMNLRRTYGPKLSTILGHLGLPASLVAYVLFANL